MTIPTTALHDILDDMCMRYLRADTTASISALIVS